MVKSVREVLEMYGKIDRWSTGGNEWFALASYAPRSQSVLRITLVSSKNNIDDLYDKLSNKMYNAVDNIENE